MKVKEESEKFGLKLNIQKTKIMASGPITSWPIDGETVETLRGFIFGGLQNHCRWWLKPWNQKKKSYDQPKQHIKKQRHFFANKGPSSQSYGFSSSHVWMWELNHKESWAPRSWCFWCCCRKEDPFQGPKLDSCLTLRNKLSKETHVLTKQEILLGKGTWVRAVG